MTERMPQSRRTTTWTYFALEVMKWTAIGILIFSILWALALLLALGIAARSD